MTIQQFIFSSKRKHRIIRHLSFWLSYSFYFFIQSIPPKRFEDFYTATPYFTASINTFSFAFFYVAITYVFIYYVYPKTIKKEKYLPFVIAFIIGYALGVFVNYFMAEFFLKVTSYQSNTFDHRLSLSYCNTRWGMIIAIIAIGLKLSKDWYLQEIENAGILKKKNRAEIQLRKSRIHPRLLLRTLDNLHLSVSNNFSNSASMVLKLSDILSYSLYESEDEFIQADKEVEGVKNLVILEQLGPEGPSNAAITITGDLSDQYIAPMILVKLLEQCITLVHQYENAQTKIAVNVAVKEDKIYMVIKALSENKSILHEKDWHQVIRSLQKRLPEHYTAADYNIQFSTKEFEATLLLELALVNKGEAVKKNTAQVYEYA